MMHLENELLLAHSTRQVEGNTVLLLAIKDAALPGYRRLFVAFSALVFVTAILYTLIFLLPIPLELGFLIFLSLCLTLMKINRFTLMVSVASRMSKTSRSNLKSTFSQKILFKILHLNFVYQKVFTHTLKPKIPCWLLYFIITGVQSLWFC